MKDLERVKTLTVQESQTHTNNSWKEENEKTGKDKKRDSRFSQQETIGPAFKT